jgi:hypothetical protein
MTRLFCGLALAGFSSIGFTCEVPSLMVIPSTEKIAEDPQTFYAEWTAYTGAMRTYMECTQAALATAGGDSAPTLTKAVLVKRNNDAYQEVQAMAALYDERVAPLVKDAPEDAPALDIPLELDLPQ